jgi:hypothetical protein
MEASWFCHVFWPVNPPFFTYTLLRHWDMRHLACSGIPCVLLTSHGLKPLCTMYQPWALTPPCLLNGFYPFTLDSGHLFKRKTMYRTTLHRSAPTLTEMIMVRSCTTSRPMNSGTLPAIILVHHLTFRANNYHCDLPLGAPLTIAYYLQLTNLHAYHLFWIGLYWLYPFYFICF